MPNLNDLRIRKPKSEVSIELASFVFFDIETTGLRPDRGAKVTEIAILNRNNCEFYWSTEKGSNRSCFHEQLPKIQEYLKNGVVVGHNLSFDFWFLSYESDRINVEGPELKFVDTLSLTRKLLPEKNSYKLGELLQDFEIMISGELHTAVTDAEATRALFWKLIEKGGISTVGEAGMKKLNWSNF